jgi:hypothetical protein
MTNSEILIFGKLFLTFAVLLGLLLWDLHRLRRDPHGRTAESAAYPDCRRIQDSQRSDACPD